MNMKPLKRRRPESLVSLLEPLEARISPATLTWVGDVNGNWNANASGNTNWSLNQLPDDSDTLVFPAGASNLAMTNDTSGAGYTLQFTGTGYSLGGNGISLRSAATALTNGSGINTINVSLGIKDSPIDVAAGGTLIVNGAILGATDLIKTGAGTLRLGGVNGYSGDTLVQAGTLQLSVGNNRLPTGTNVVLGNGTTPAVLDLRNFSQTLAGLVAVVSTSRVVDSLDDTTVPVLTLNLTTANTFIGILGNTGQNGFALTKTGTATLSLSGANTYTGATRIENGTLQILSGDNRLPVGTSVTLGSGTNSGRLDLSGHNQTLADLATSGTGTNNQVSTFDEFDPSVLTLNISGTKTFSGMLRGSLLSLTKTGPGTLILTGANTYAGPTTFDQGAIQLDALNRIGTGALTFTGGTLQFAGVFDPSTRTVTFGSGGGTFDTNGNAITIANTVGNGGVGTFTKTGAGTLTLAAAASYTGATTIADGMLRLSGADNLLSTTAGLTLGTASTSGILDLNNRSQTLTSLTTGTTGATNRVIDSTNDGTFPTLTLNMTTSATFGGTLGNTGQNGFALAKSGSGTLTLTGANTYTGATTLSGGFLRVNGSLAAGSAISVTGGTLGGTGTIFGTVTLGPAGTLAPGSPTSSTGRLTVGSVAWSDINTSYSVQVNGATPDILHDQLVVTGTVNLSGATLSRSGTITTAPGQRIVLIDNDGTDAVIGTFSGLAEGATVTINGTAFAMSYVGGDGNDVTLAQVDTDVRLSGGSLIITDVNGGTSADTLTIRRVGTSPNFSLEISDLVNVLNAGVGTTQVNANTVTVPLTSVTGSVTINTLDGDDAVTLDFSGGNVLTAGGLAFNGGANVTTGDRLTLTGGSTTTVTHNFLVSGVGGVTLAGALAGSISYTALEPLTDSLGATNRVFDFGSAESATITLSDAGTTLMAVGAVTFPDPTTSLTINGSGGADTITIASLDAAFAGSLTINGGAFDTLSLPAGMPTLASLTAAAASITLNSVTTTGAQSYTGAVTLGANTTLTGTNVNLGGTIGGAFALAVNASGTTIFGGNISGLTSLTTNAAGTTALNAASIGVATASFGDPVILGADTTLTTANAAVSFNSTVNADAAANNRTLTVNAGTAGVSFSGTVGGAQTLQGLSVTAGALGAGAIALNTGGALTTTVGATSTITGVISGTGATLTKSGVGTLNVSGANTYTGATAIQNGTLRLSGASGQLPASTMVTLGSGSSSGILDLNNRSQTLTGLVVGGGTTNRVIDSTNDAAVPVLTLNIATTNTFTGILGNAGQNGFALTKSGAGTLTLTGANTYTGTTTINAGTLNLNSALTAANVTLSGGTLGGTAALTVTNMLDWTGGTMSGSGGTTLAATAALSISGAGTKTLAGRTLNLNGSTTWTGTGNLSVSSATTINNAGTFNIQTDADTTGAGALTFNNTGTLRKSGGTATPTSFGAGSVVVTSGLVLVEAGTLRFDGSFTQTAGSTQLSNTTLASGSTLVFQGGELSGEGAVTGNVNNIGATVRPGGTVAARTLTISGTYTQGAGGTLAVELGGTGAGQFDVLSVSGTTALGGTLNIVNLAAFNPSVGNQFRVITSPNNPGSFAMLTGDSTGIMQTPDAAGLVLTATAQNFVWDGGAGADRSWFNPLNWNIDAGFPSDGDTAILGLVGGIIDVGSNVTVGTFTQTAGMVQGVSNLTVKNSFTWSGGTLSGTGTLIVPAGSTLTLSGAGVKTLNQRAIDNSGTVLVTGSGSLSLLNGPTITNRNLWDFQSDADIAQTDAISSVFRNEAGATLRKSVGNVAGASVIGLGNATLAFTNNAAIDVQTGTLTVFSSGGTWAGSPSLAMAAGTALQFTGGNFTWSVAPALSGGGTLDIGGATSITLGTGTTTVPSPLTLALSGTITGAGSLAISGAMNWTGGTMSGSGSTTIGAGATLTMSGASVKTLAGRTLNLNGTTTWMDAGNIAASSATTINNAGVFDMQTDAGTTGALTFNNTGTLKKSAGAGTTIFGAGSAVSTSGTVQAQAGTLHFASTFMQTAGSMQLAGGTLATASTLAFQGGELTGVGSITGSVSNTGATVRPGGTGAAGTITISSNYTQDTGGTLAVELGGTGAGQFDVLAVGGTATLGGTANAANLGSFVPVVGDQFRVVTSANNPGIFQTLSGQTIGLTQAADASGLRLVRNAVSFTWDAGAGADTSWFTAANWTPEQAPGPGDTAVLNTTATIDLPAAMNARVGSFTQSAGTVAGAGSLTVSSTLTLSGGALNFAGAANAVSATMSGGTLGGSGTLTVSSALAWTGGTMSGSGATTLAAGSVATMSGAAVKTLAGRAVNVGGTLTWTGTGNFALNSGTLTVQSGGLFDIQTGASIGDIDSGAAGALVVAGTLRKSAGTQTSIGGNLGAGTGSVATMVSAGGLVQVQSGTVQFDGAVASSGGFNAAAGSVLRFSAGTSNLNSGTALAGTGSYQLTGGTLNINTALNAANVTISGGTLGGSGTLTVASALAWSGGTMSGSGATTVSGATTISGAGDKTLSARTLNLNGPATWSGTGNLVVSAAATINNAATFDIQTDADIPGALTFNNTMAGTLRKSAGVATTSFGAGSVVNTSGTVQALIGTLQFAGGFTQTDGSTQLAGGALATTTTLAFQGGELRGAGTISGSVDNTGATVRPGGTGAAGTIAISGAYTQGAGGTLAAEIVGTGAGQFDVLAVGGAATLDGALSVSFLGGFVPVFGDTFNVVGAGTRSGTFASVAGATLLTPNYTGTAAQLVRNAVAFTWDAGGVADTSWLNPLNWDANFGFPGANDTAVLGIAATINVTGSLGVGTFQQSAGTLTGAGLSVLANFAWSGGTQSGAGSTTVAAGATFSLSGAGAKTLDTRALSLGGNTTAASSGNLTLLNGATITNSALFDAQGDFIFVSGAGGGTFTNAAAGTLRKSAGAGSTAWQVPFANAGVVQPQAGTMLFTGGYTQTAGSTQLGAGLISATTPLALQGGQLTGVGAISAGVNNTGATIRPGGTGAAGTITVSGNYTQGGGGVLAAELGGTDAGQFDVLSVTGNTTLGGTLNLANLNGFTPGGGDTLRVVQSANNPGTFAALSGSTAGISQSADASGLVLTAAALTFVWDNSAGTGDWFNPLNWDRDLLIPGAGDNAILNINSTIVLASIASVGNFTQTAGTLGGASALTVFGTLNWQGGQMAGGGTTAIAPGGTLSIDTGALHQLSGRTIDNSGTINWIAGNLRGDTAGSVINNLSGANFNAQNDSFSEVTGGGTLTINIQDGATLTKTGAGTTDFGFGTTFNDDGEVNVIGGTLTLQGGASAGTFAVGAGATLGFAGSSTQELGSSSLVTGAGTVSVSGGTTNVAGTYAITGATNVSGGAINFMAAASTGGASLSAGTMGGDGALTINGAFGWSGGAMAGGGTTIISAGSTLTISGGGLHLLSARTLENFGTIDWTGTGGIRGDSGASAINNQSGGVFNAQSGAFTEQTGGGTLVVNNRAGATLTKTGAGTTTDFGAGTAFNNAGMIDVRDGTLRFDTAFTQTAGSTALNGGALAANGALVFQGGTLGGTGTIAGSVSNTGATVQPGGMGAAGTLTITGAYAQGVGGALEIELGGTGAGQFDVLSVGGTATLNGDFVTMVLDGFTPPDRSVFAVIGTGTRNGAFATTTLPAEITAFFQGNAVVLTGPFDPLQVTTEADVVDALDGEVSLREAIVFANANAGLDTITFNIAGTGVRTITPATALPVITDAVIMDGTTQPGAASGSLLIEINGTNIGGAASGLEITAGGSTVRGLVLNRFSSGGAIFLNGSGGNVIEGNFIGTDASGTSALGNLHGVVVSGAGAIGNAVADNVIAFNTGAGVVARAGARGAAIMGNSIHDNGGLGIDLDDDGFTANDATDADAGANDRLNFPVIASAVSTSSGANVSGSVTTAVNGIVRLEFFRADASGEGLIFLGTTDVVSVAGMPIAFDAALAGSVSVGDRIVATTSDLADSGAGTSEFSSAATVIPPVLISVGDAAIVEGDSGTKQLVFTLALDQAVNATVTVNFNTADFSTDARSATAGDDYIAVSGGLVTFAPNELTRTFAITISGDTAGEPVERFKVVLSNPTNAGLADGEGVGAIVDEDHHKFAVGEGSGNGFSVFTATATGATLVQAVDVFSAGYKGGVRVATGDVTGDGVDDFIAGGGLGSRAKVRVFDGVTFAPVAGVLGDLSAFGKTYRGGVFVAAGDVNGDGFADVIVTPSAGSSNQVRIFSGADGSLINNFRAFGKGTGGVRVAAGDVNGDGLADIIAGTGTGSSVRVFDALSGQVLAGEGREFRAFGSGYRGGVYVAAGDLDADGVADIIVGAGAGAPHVRSYLQGIGGAEPTTFAAYAGRALLGVRVAALDVDSDGIADIITTKARRAVLQIGAFDGGSRESLFVASPFGNQRGSLYVG